jgi:hypothetical protein
MIENKTARMTNKWLIIIALALIPLMAFFISAISGVEQYVDPDTVNETDVITFSATWSSGNYNKVLFCKESSCNDCYYINNTQTLEDSGCWCTNTSFTGSSASCTYTTSESDESTNSFYTRFYNASDKIATDGQIHTSGIVDSEFKVNHKPTITEVNITPLLATDIDDLTCNHNANTGDTGIDDTIVVTNYTWKENGSPIAGQTSSTLASSQFQVGNNISCGVSVTDSLGLSTSSFVYSENVTISESTPSGKVTALITRASPSFVNESENVTLEINWTGNNQRVFVCKDSSCNTCYYSQENPSFRDYSGCYGYTTSFVDETFSFNINTSGISSQDNPFYIRFYNTSQTTKDSGPILDPAGYPNDNDVSFEVNHAPIITSVYLDPANPNIYNNITCNYQASAEPDGDSVTATYRWNVNDVNVTSFTLNDELTNSSFSELDNVTCEVKLTDEHGFFTINESAKVTVQDPSPTITLVIDNSNFTSQIRIGEVVVFNTSWSDPNSLNTTTYICNSTSINSNGCSGKTYCEVNSSSSPSSCSYTVQESDLLETPSHNKTYYSGVCNINGYCSVSSDYWFYIYNDTWEPEFNLSLISNTSITKNNTFNFTVTDDTNLSLETLNITFTNSTTTINSLTSNDVTCNGDIQTLTCSFEQQLEDGEYNITFKINDSVSNNATAIKSFVVQTSIEQRINSSGMTLGYYNGTDFQETSITTSKHIYVDWQDLVLPGGIINYQYALGIGQTYGSLNWNSVNDWTNVTNSFANLTASLSPGYTYYFHLRAKANSGIYTNATSSLGIYYEDTSSPACIGGSGTGGCIVDDGVWSNDNSQVTALLNFTETDSEIIEYQYAIGTKAYPDPAYNNVASGTTSDPNLEVNGLSLEDNKTYYISARARNENPDNSWSDWYYSDGIKIDSSSPSGGYISFLSHNTTTNKVNISFYSGTDSLSGVDGSSGILKRSKVSKLPSQTCSEVTYSNFQDIMSVSNGPTTVLVTLESGYCYSFRYQISDIAGNSVTYSKESNPGFFVDTTPPSDFSVILQSNNLVTYSNDWTAQINDATDPESSIDYFTYALYKEDGSSLGVSGQTTNTQITLSDLSLEDEIGYYLNVTAHNNLGLSTTIKSNKVIFLDNTAPEMLSIVSIAGDGNSSNGYVDLLNDGITNINLNASETSLSCVVTDYDIPYTTNYNISLCTTYSSNTSVICPVNKAEGNHTVYISCQDSNGNAQGADKNLEVNWISDWNGPIINITSPDNEGIVAGIVRLSAQITDPGFGEITSNSYKIKNLTGETITSGILTYSSGEYYANWDSSNYEGTFYLEINASDKLSRNSSEEIIFSINRNLPYVTVEHSSVTSENIFNITVVAQVFTNYTLDVINSSGNSVYQNSITVPDNVNNGYNKTVYEIDISDQNTWTEGKYNVSLISYNNQSLSSNKSSYFWLDRKAPVYSALTDTASNTYYNNESVIINSTWSDSAGIKEVRFVLVKGNETLRDEEVDSNDNTTYSVTISELENNATYYWNFTAKDGFDKENKTETYNFTVTNRPPLVNNSFQKNYSVSRGNNTFELDLTGLFYDRDYDDLVVKGIASVNLSVNITSGSSGNITLIRGYFNFSTGYTGVESIVLNVTDPYDGFNQTTLTFNITNLAPVENNKIPNFAWLKNTNFSFDFDDYYSDPDGDNLNYSYSNKANSNITVSINQTTGVILLVPDNNWTGNEWIVFNITDGQHKLNSTNITLYVVTNTSNSTLINSYIDGTYYENEQINYLQNITVSTIENSTVNLSDVDSSTINLSVLRNSQALMNSLIFNSTVYDTYVYNSNILDSFVDPSRIINSTIKGNSNVTDSNITNANVTNTNITNSNITNSSLEETHVINATVNDMKIISGKILLENGTYYDATVSGVANLTDLINYAPVAVLENSYSGETSEVVSLTSTTYDRNIQGPGSNSLNDSLTYNWTFGDGTNATTNISATSKTYSSTGTYTLTLIVKDKFNKTSTTTSTVTITSPSSGDGDSSGGGSSGGSSGGSISQNIDTEEQTSDSDVVAASMTYEGENLTIGFGSEKRTIRITYSAKDYEMKIKGIGSTEAEFEIDTVPSRRIKLSEGEEISLDLNNDDIKDVSIILEDARVSNKATFYIKRLSVDVMTPVSEPEDEPAQPSTQTELEEITDPETQQPQETPIYEEAKKSSSGIFTMLIVIVILGGLVGGGYYLYKKNMLPVAAFEELLNPQKDKQPVSFNPQMVAMRLPITETPVVMKVRELFETGTEMPEIVNALKAEGSDNELVYNGLVEYFVRRELMQGRGVEDIYSDMTSKGWDENRVFEIIEKYKGLKQ